MSSSPGQFFFLTGLGGCDQSCQDDQQKDTQQTPGEISSNLYRASVCDMKKRTFLLISLSQILNYTLQTTWYGMTKNIIGKLPDHLWLQISTFNFEGCHTLTQIFQILIIITFFNPIDG